MKDEALKGVEFWGNCLLAILDGEVPFPGTTSLEEALRDWLKLIDQRIDEAAKNGWTLTGCKYSKSRNIFWIEFSNEGKRVIRKLPYDERFQIDGAPLRYSHIADMILILNMRIASDCDRRIGLNPKADWIGIDWYKKMIER
jgi:hypothetical protein